MRRFLIAGCQRSGTTLMRLVLESHKAVQCYDEAHAYKILAGQTELPMRANTVGFKIPIWSEQLLNRTLDWNGISEFSDQGPVPNFYRGEPIIFLIRRPLDTISSMSRLKDGSHSWLDRFGAPIIQNYCTRRYFREAFRADLETALCAQHRDIAFGALYWKFKSLAALKYMDAELPIHLVFYEELVTDPASVLRSVVDHLSLEWDESILGHHLRDHAEIFSGRAIGNTDPSRPIDSRSIGLWEKNISKPDAQVIEQIAGPLEKTLYSLSDKWRPG